MTPTWSAPADSWRRKAHDGNSGRLRPAGASSGSGLVISVLIPLYNGARTIEPCLSDWLSQDEAALEVVVADNGSTDEGVALVERLAAVMAPGRLRLLRETLAGQSAASNTAARAARGELLVFSAQDMRVPPDLARRHREALQRHRSRIGPALPLAVQGHITYPPGALATPFMRCLVEETSFQFAFDQAGDPLDADPKCLYAPNFSMEAATFRRLGGFDETFPYGWQDTDLGFRLQGLGGRLVYEAGLVAWHDHPVAGRAYCARMEAVGRDCPRFLSRHPEALDRERLRQGVSAHFLQGGRLASAASRLIRVAEEHPDAPLPPLELEGGPARDSLHAAWVILLKYHLYKGIHDGGRSQWGAGCWKDLGRRGSSSTRSEIGNEETG